MVLDITPNTKFVYSLIVDILLKISNDFVSIFLEVTILYYRSLHNLTIDNTIGSAANSHIAVT